MIIEGVSGPNAMHRLTSEGFLLVSLPKEARTAIDSTFRSGATFFRQTEREKSMAGFGGDLGYRAFGVEYSSSPEHPDQMESFTVSRDCGDRLRQLPNAKGQILGREMANSFELFASTAASVIRSLAMFFGQRSHDLLSKSLPDWSIFQLNYSRPSQAKGTYINEKHEDGCLITVAPVTGHGLEVQSNCEQFIPVTPAHDQLLVFPGEILHLLSGGLIKPCYHRVNVVDYLPERMSLLLFADIDPSLCVPWVIGDANRGINIGDRVLKNSMRFGLKEWVAE